MGWKYHKPKNPVAMALAWTVIVMAIMLAVAIVGAMTNIIWTMFIKGWLAADEFFRMIS